MKRWMWKLLWLIAFVATFIQTCGGMVQFDWPDGLSRDDIGDNRNPRGEAIKALIGLAEKCARLVLPRD